MSLFVQFFQSSSGCGLSSRTLSGFIQVAWVSLLFNQIPQWTANALVQRPLQRSRKSPRSTIGFVFCLWILSQTLKFVAFSLKLILINKKCNASNQIRGRRQVPHTQKVSTADNNLGWWGDGLLFQRKKSKRTQGLLRAKSVIKYRHFYHLLWISVENINLVLTNEFEFRMWYFVNWFIAMRLVRFLISLMNWCRT